MEHEPKVRARATPPVASLPAMPSRDLPDKSTARHAGANGLAAFFLIACIPTWIGWSLLTFHIVPSAGPWQALYLTGWSASAAGLAATYVEDGRRGLRRLLARAVRIAVPIRWWLFVLLVPQLMGVATVALYVALSARAVTFEPSGFSSLMTPSMLAPFFLGPFGEEFGWRGYLLPRLAGMFSVVPAVLLVGVVWAVWHWPLLYHSLVAAPGTELATVVIAVASFSVLLGTVYLRSGSLLLAMIMHWNIDTWPEMGARIFKGLPDRTDPLLTWCGLGTSVLIAALAIPALVRAGRAIEPALRSPLRSRRYTSPGAK